MSKARCKNCDTTIESKHRHQWVCCECFMEEDNNHGFFLDGGLDYIRYGGNEDDIEWIDQRSRVGGYFNVDRRLDK